MRITSGKYKGRMIKMPRKIRPTQEKVRKALFDILGNIEGISFLELFAGSGAIGIEALSRGAGRVVFVEKDRGCARIIEHNLSLLDCRESSVIAQGAARALKRLSKQGQKFEIIFLDPPYYKRKVPRLRPSLRFRTQGTILKQSEESRSGLAETGEGDSLAKKTLQILSDYDILSRTGFVVVQHFKQESLPQGVGDLILFKQATYGDSVLSFYRTSRDCPRIVLK